MHLAYFQQQKGVTLLKKKKKKEFKVTVTFMAPCLAVVATFFFNYLFYKFFYRVLMIKLLHF